MKEAIKINLIEWTKLFGFVLAITLFLWVFIMPTSFRTTFCLTLFIVVLPILWFNKGKTFEFWVWICGKNGLKTAIAAILFLIVRGYISYAVNFTPISSLAKFNERAVVTNFFGFSPQIVLFELTFTLLAGLMVCYAVFGGTHAKSARFSLCGFLVLCLILQGFNFTAPKVVQKAGEPLQQETIADQVEDHGALGAMAKQTWQAAFGKKTVTSGALKTISAPGSYYLNLDSGQEVLVKFAATGGRYQLYYDRGNRFKRINPGGSVCYNDENTAVPVSQFQIVAISDCRITLIIL